MQEIACPSVVPMPSFRSPIEGHRIAAVLSAFLLSGCALIEGDGPTTMLRVVQSSYENDDNSSNRFQAAETIQDFKEQLNQLLPDLKLHFSTIPSKSLIADLRAQTQSGLGPDLVVTDSSEALRLLSNGLTEPIPQTQESSELIFPSALKRVTANDGSLAGQPIGQYRQLACYDKRQIKDPPETLAALSAASQKGKKFGIATKIFDLYWSVGSFRAGEALAATLEGKKPTAAASQRLTNWLRWLKDFSYQQNILFYRNQAGLRQGLVEGDLDWISCWSSQIPQLTQALKTNLGIYHLPDGASGQSTPITRLQVWSLGKNSSKNQREQSLRLLNFMVQPWAQKTYSLRYRTLYPVNPSAAQIVNRKLPGSIDRISESELKRVARGDAIVAAIDQYPDRIEALQSTLSKVIFGGLSPKEATLEIQTKLKEK